MTDHVVSDTGPFAIVPVWVLDHLDLSDRAVRLYGILARYADETGRAWPRRSVLGKRLGTSVKSIDRAVAELEKARAVSVHPRYDDGGQRSNLYLVHRACPYPETLESPPPGHGGPGDPGHASPPGGVNGDAQKENQGNESHSDPESMNEKKKPRPEVVALCDLLADLIEENGSKRPTITKAWLDACRLLIDKDDRTPDRIETIVRWSQADEFWRSNVLSMPTLRRQFDRLRLARNASLQRKGGGRSALESNLEVLADLHGQATG